MEARNVTRENLDQALAEVNRRYNGNVTWNRSPECKNQKATRWGFTLRVHSSQGPGHGLGFHQGRRLVSACWHVHGHFFDALLAVAPDAVVYSRGGGVRIDADGGNWQDFNTGSMMRPRAASEACECPESQPPLEVYFTGRGVVDPYTVILDSGVFTMSRDALSAGGVNQYVGLVGRDLDGYTVRSRRTGYGTLSRKSLDKLPPDVLWAIADRVNVLGERGVRLERYLRKLSGKQGELDLAANN